MNLGEPGTCFERDILGACFEEDMPGNFEASTVAFITHDRFGGSPDVFVVVEV